MIIGKKTQVATGFKPTIYLSLIKQTDNLRYLGVNLDNKLSWCCGCLLDVLSLDEYKSVFVFVTM